MCKKDWQSNKTRLSTGVADLDGSGPREGSRVALRPVQNDPALLVQHRPHCCIDVG